MDAIDELGVTSSPQQSLTPNFKANPRCRQSKEFNPSSGLRSASRPLCHEFGLWFDENTNLRLHTTGWLMEGKQPYHQRISSRGCRGATILIGTTLTLGHNWTHKTPDSQQLPFIPSCRFKTSKAHNKTICVSHKNTSVRIVSCHPVFPGISNMPRWDVRRLRVSNTEVPTLNS